MDATSSSSDSDDDRPMALIGQEIKEPQTYQEAITDSHRNHWKQAMKNETDSLAKNKTWTLTELPKGRKVIKNRWILKIKRDRDENEIYKARLVAKGSSQKEEIDYQETYAPVVKYNSLRILLAVAAAREFSLVQFDVKTAFLHGTLKEELYMEQPTGFNNGTTQACKLEKGLYGLKQSPRAWNARIKDVLEKQGMTQLKADNCVFKNQDGSIYLVLYVDDGLVLKVSSQK